VADEAVRNVFRLMAEVNNLRAALATALRERDDARGELERLRGVKGALACLQDDWDRKLEEATFAVATERDALRAAIEPTEDVIEHLKQVDGRLSHADVRRLLAEIAARAKGAG
jgi:predicted  nucleic acid-binding Zn-ribbon protein